jgi:hypothetical protein
MLIISGGGPLSVLASVLVAVVTLAVLTFVGWFTDRLLGGYADVWARRLQDPDHDQDQDRDPGQDQEQPQGPARVPTTPRRLEGEPARPVVPLSAAPQVGDDRAVQSCPLR